MDDIIAAALREVQHVPSVMPLPWEAGLAGTVFGQRGVMASHLELVSVNAPLPPLRCTALEKPIVSAKRIQLNDQFKIKRFSAKARPAIEDSEGRFECLRSWLEVVDKMGETFAVFNAIPWTASVEQQVNAISDYVENKATGTLATRLNPWLLFFKWADGTGYAVNNLDEPMAHEYLTWMLAETKAATRPASFLGAVGFCLGAFGFGVGQLILMSPRVRGVSLRGLKTKKVTRKRDTLKMWWVRALESAVVDALRRPADSVLSQQEAVVAGFMLMLVHTRTRNKDLARVVIEPSLDLSEDRSAGYIEAETTGDATKTGNTIKKARMQVPIVGLAFGLSKVPWAEAWLEIRCLVGLSAPCDECLMREPLANGTFGAGRIDAALTSEWLKHLLHKVGVPKTELCNVGSHSCKATLLALLAKIGATPDDRRLLGGHAQQGDKSVMEYSRDALAGPLSRLEKALEMVQEGIFDPDATRSGRWKRRVGNPVASVVAACISTVDAFEAPFEVSMCASCAKVVSDGVTIIEECECGAVVHAEPPLLRALSLMLPVLLCQMPSRGSSWLPRSGCSHQGFGLHVRGNWFHLGRRSAGRCGRCQGPSTRWQLVESNSNRLSARRCRREQTLGHRAQSVHDVRSDRVWLSND